MTSIEAGPRHRALMVVAVVVATVLAVSAFLATVAQAEPTPGGISGNWSLIFDDEFTGAGPNTSVWTPNWVEHGGTPVAMGGTCASNANARQPGNGYLYLELTQTQASCSGKSTNAGGLVESNPTDGSPGHIGFTFQYGVIEWRAYTPGIGAKGCPKGGCIPDFPALWSLPVSHHSEIDTMEGLNSLGQACFHVPPPFGSSAPGECRSGSYAGWHTYAADWEPSGNVNFYYDDAYVGHEASSEVNEPQYLVMDMVNSVDGQPVQIPDSMTVDYVRVWQRAPELGFIKIGQVGSGTVEVHWDALTGGSYHRQGDTTSDFSPNEAANGPFQLLEKTNGWPQLGFIKLLNTGGTVEVHRDVYNGSKYARLGDYSSDFNRPYTGEGTFQLVGYANGAPELGLIKYANTESHTIEVFIDQASGGTGGTYSRVLNSTSDFSPSAAANGRFVLFGSYNGRPELGYIQEHNTGSGKVEVYWDVYNGSSYVRAGSGVSDFTQTDVENGGFSLYTTGGAPTLRYIKERNTGSGTVEVFTDDLYGTQYVRTLNATSDFELSNVGLGGWYVEPFALRRGGPKLHRNRKSRGVVLLAG